MLRKGVNDRDRIEQLAVQKDLTGRMLWNRVKKLAGWATALSPIKFSTENGVVSEPKLMANLLNNYFCEKVSNICQELSTKNKSDPL